MKKYILGVIVALLIGAAFYFSNYGLQMINVKSDTATMGVNRLDNIFTKVEEDKISGEVQEESIQQEVSKVEERTASEENSEIEESIETEERSTIDQIESTEVEESAQDGNPVNEAETKGNVEEVSNQSEDKGWQCIIIGDMTVNVRETAEKSGKKIGSVKPGEIVTLVEEQGEWSHIRNDRVDGYVVTRVLKKK